MNIVASIIVLSGCLLTVLYLVLIGLYHYGWRRQSRFAPPPGYHPEVRISIIIPARNEAMRLHACLSSLLAQQYPAHLVEIIVVDDHSEDETAAIAAGFHPGRVRCIRLADHLAPGERLIAYKKKALTTGIEASTGTLIITTDADCVAPPDWLQTIAAYYQQHQPAMIVAPVDFTTNGSVVAVFQSLDFMTMQGITAAVHTLNLGNMSNGANLTFTRAAFDQVNGYEGTEHLASGDDYVLTTRMREVFPGRIHYLKSAAAIIRTPPQPDWRSFLQQRIRWASKSGKYGDTRLTGMLVLVYLYNLTFLPATALAVVAPSYIWLPLTMGLAKTAAEICFLYSVSFFFGKRRQLWWFPILQPVHIMYILAAGLLGFVGVYKWKGRHISTVPARSAKGGRIIQDD